MFKLGVAHGLHREHEWEPNSALMLEVIIGTRITQIYTKALKR